MMGRRSVIRHPVLRLSAGLIVLFATLPLSCDGSAGSAGIPDAGLEFTTAELQRIEALQENGVLRAATSRWPGVYEIRDGEVTGYHALLVSEVARRLGLDVEFVPVAFEEFFTVNGVAYSGDGARSPAPAGDASTDSAEGSPDIFRRADLIVYDLTILPWREQLMRFIPVVPTRMVVLTPGDKPIRQLGDMSGKTAAVWGSTSHQGYLERLNDYFDLAVNIMPVDSSVDTLSLVDRGEADFSVRDSNSALLSLGNHTDITVPMALGPVVTNGWAVSLRDGALASAISKIVEELIADGTADRLFRRTYGMDLAGYSTIIGNDPAGGLVLSAEELDHLTSLRDAGGLSVAIDQEQVVYEPRSQGGASGLHYNLLLAVADLLDIPLKLEPVNFPQFFEKDGAVDQRLMTDPQFSYTPDLLVRNQLYVATMSRTDWREKFLKFLPLYPTTLSFVIREGEEKISADKLAGKTYALLRNTTYESWLRSQIDLSELTVIDAASGEDAVRMVSRGIADVAVSDTAFVLALLDQYENVTFYPADPQFDVLSWAVARENTMLHGILEKTLDVLRRDGTFAAIWNEYYPLPLDDYLSLLDTPQ
jgi:ABC-type amino acid transport substrate-binding protein